MDVHVIGIEQARPFILKKHYAKRMPNVMFSFGGYIGTDLVGIVTYGMPPSPSLCKGVCGDEHKGKVIELNRLVVDRGSASELIGKSLKQLPTPKIVVSYADTGMGHVGYVYQATNWLYTGFTKERTDMLSESGHSRHNLGDRNLRQVRTSKHRYVYFLGNHKQKKEFIRSLNYKPRKYPKGDTEKYEVTARFPTQMLLV